MALLPPQLTNFSLDLDRKLIFGSGHNNHDCLGTSSVYGQVLQLQAFHMYMRGMWYPSPPSYSKAPTAVGVAMDGLASTSNHNSHHCQAVMKDLRFVSCKIKMIDWVPLPKGMEKCVLQAFHMATICEGCGILPLPPTKAPQQLWVSQWMALLPPQPQLTLV